MAVQQVLYRRYRPQTFSALIGQKHIATALTNQIKNNTISHAYIFNGTRGVGKTSSARIFARAVNCLNPHNGEPCLKCTNCLDYANGGSIDIIEIDAASNNGVEFARELREKVAYAPNVSKYKVYIIDEAQMLTSSAFDALLKTLEEPPEHVIFILCTTEIHKFPATILSRCMRFDFHLVSVEEISALLCGIFDEIEVKYTPDAVNEIASAAEGSVRDALTVADRCVALTGKKLTYDTVLSVLGATSKEDLIDLANSIINNRPDKVLETTNTMVNEGKSVTVLARDLCKHFRDLVIIKTCKTAEKLLLMPADIYKKLEKTANTAEIKKLLYAVEQLATLETQLRESLAPQVLLESVLLKLSCSSGLVDLDGLDMRITRLEKLIAEGFSAKPQTFAKHTAEPEAKATPPTITNTVSPKTPDSAVPTPSKDAEKAQTAVKPEEAPAKTPETEQKTETPVEVKPAAVVKPSMTISAVSIWADLLAVARLEGETLFVTILSEIKDVQLSKQQLIAYCTVAQQRALNDKRYESLITRVLGKYGIRLTVKDALDEQDSSSEDLKSIFGNKLKIE